MTWLTISPLTSVHDSAHLHTHGELAYFVHAGATPLLIIKVALTARMGMLTEVFMSSIQQINSDKEYFLSKLKQYNDVVLALADYLSELNETAVKGGEYSSESASYTTCKLEKS